MKLLIAVSWEELLFAIILINIHSHRRARLLLMNRVPERHIDFVCVIFYKIISTLPFKIMKEKFVEYFTN